MLRLWSSTPTLFGDGAEAVAERLSSLASLMGVPHSSARTLVAGYPRLLLQRPESLAAKAAALQALLALSPTRLGAMLAKWPALLTLDARQYEARVERLAGALCMKPKELQVGRRGGGSRGGGGGGGGEGGGKGGRGGGGGKERVRVGGESRGEQEMVVGEVGSLGLPSCTALCSPILTLPSLCGTSSLWSHIGRIPCLCAHTLVTL